MITHEIYETAKENQKCWNGGLLRELEEDEAYNFK